MGLFGRMAIGSVLCACVPSHSFLHAPATAIRHAAVGHPPLVRGENFVYPLCFLLPHGPPRFSESVVAAECVTEWPSHLAVNATDKKYPHMCSNSPLHSLTDEM